MTTELLICSRRCDQCLTTPERIVSGERAAQLVKKCRREDVHFVCHKGSAAGLNVHCRGVHEIAPSRSYRFASCFGIPIREVDPSQLEIE